MSASLTDLINDLRPSLPILVEVITWDGTRLSFGGADWGLFTMSPWRLVSGDRMVLGSEEASETVLREALGDHFITDVVSGGPPDIDPTFIFNSGMRLQVFSIHSLEPWTFRTREGKYYIAEPMGGPTS